MAHEGPPPQGTPLRIDLEEVAPGEFLISVVWREKTLGSLYLRGNRREAAAFLEEARQRIVVAITGDGLSDVDKAGTARTDRPQPQQAAAELTPGTFLRGTGMS